MHTYLEFERPIAELEGKIVELRKLAEEDPTMDIDGDVARLQARADLSKRANHVDDVAEPTGREKLRGHPITLPACVTRAVHPPLRQHLVGALVFALRSLPIHFGPDARVIEVTYRR